MIFIEITSQNKNSSIGNLKIECVSTNPEMTPLNIVFYVFLVEI